MNLASGLDQACRFSPLSRSTVNLKVANCSNASNYKSNCAVCVYVADHLVAAPNDDEIRHVQRAFETEFRLNNLRTPRSLLGIQFDFQAMDLCPSTNTVHPNDSLRLLHNPRPCP
jgi:hypothetical protein